MNGQTLLTVGAVSRRWRTVVDDAFVWRVMCARINITGAYAHFTVSRIVRIAGLDLPAESDLKRAYMRHRRVAINWRRPPDADCVLRTTIGERYYTKS
jgi:hypothetical protein